MRVINQAFYYVLDKKYICRVIRQFPNGNCFRRLATEFLFARKKSYFDSSCSMHPHSSLFHHVDILQTLLLERNLYPPYLLIFNF